MLVDAFLAIHVFSRIYPAILAFLCLLYFSCFSLLSIASFWFLLLFLPFLLLCCVASLRFLLLLRALVLHFLLLVLVVVKHCLMLLRPAAGEFVQLVRFVEAN